MMLQSQTLCLMLCVENTKHQFVIKQLHVTTFKGHKLVIGHIEPRDFNNLTNKI